MTGIFYIGTKVAESSKRRLGDWMARAGIPQPADPKTFHVTIIYSREPLSLALFSREVSWQAQPKEFKIFDNRADMSKRTLVMTLEAPEVYAWHYHYRSAYNAKHDYPDFTPHLTLSYNVPQDFNVEQLSVPDFNIDLVEEYATKLGKDDWTGQDRRELDR